ncbi:MAG TPA: DUF5640 domain-containing protein [Candidatus Thermoplasmatota archaeon]|nr:DUF5640 domain-containing protein [Candidatus Thermoplasmatota archaeon]
MKKQLIIGVILTILVCVGLSGCESTNTPETNIIGKWQKANTTRVETLDFLENGNFSLTIVQNVTWGMYMITEKTLVLNFYGRNASYSYSFSNDNQRITLVSLGNKNITVNFIRSERV